MKKGSEIQSFYKENGWRETLSKYSLSPTALKAILAGDEPPASKKKVKKKAKAAAVVESDDVSDEPAEKKGGKAKAKAKAKAEHDDSGGDEGAPAPKKRGRPKKIRDEGGAQDLPPAQKTRKKKTSAGKSTKISAPPTTDDFLLALAKEVITIMERVIVKFS